MTELKFRSAGVSAREIDLSTPQDIGPVGTPAGVIGTALQGPAFVPITVGSTKEFLAKFGDTNGKPGAVAMVEWLKFSRAGTFLRVLGAGKGEKRTTSGNNIGKVESAGFVVGEQEPDDSGNFGNNKYANLNGVLGKTYFLGGFMLQASSVTIFSDAFTDGVYGGSTVAHPIVRGVIMAASGVVPTLSSSITGSAAPSTSAVATETGHSHVGYLTGAVILTGGKQEFVMLLNGHKGSDTAYPNVVTASFDTTAPNYFANVFNTDPLKLQTAGYYLYANYDIHSAQAVMTGTGVYTTPNAGIEEIAFLTTGTAGRDTGTSTAPNYENFEDRFKPAKTPWIISQRYGGSPVNLFRIETISDGAVSDLWKVSIENIVPSTSDTDLYGTFDLVLRNFDDNDDDREILESYRGISLNPSHDRFIAKVIGDKKVYFDFDKVLGSQKLVEEGSYPNRSPRIRVVMADTVVNGDADPTALPVGFRGPQHLVTSGSSPLTTPDSASAVVAHKGLKAAVEAPIPFRENIKIGVSPKQVVNKNLYWGVQFHQKVSATEPNKSLVLNETVRSYTKYFPNFMTSIRNVAVGDNAGTADSDGTILDSDRFNNNLFSLENIQVTTGSDGKADTKEFDDWTYVRRGNITASDSAKTRAFSVTTDLSVPAVRSVAKFSLFFQGGFDGVNIFNKEESEMSNRAVIEEMDFSARGQDSGPTVRTYKKALEIMEETSDVDINLLAIPGIRHNIVTDSAILTAERRFDALYIMDIEERDTLNTVVTSSIQDINITNTVNAHSSRGLNSSFGAAFFPDVVMSDPSTGVLVRMPPSTAVLGALSLNDSIGFPWFAPAGYTRGILQSVERAVVRLSRDKMDELQDVDINPIVAFQGGPGLTIWGQKTLLNEQNSLDRINVRRLLLELRRRVKQVGQRFVFEQNVPETLAKFSAEVDPILRRVQEQSGIDKYKVFIDASTTTQADVDNLTIRGAIVIKPVRAAEFVSVDFVVTNRGVQLG